MREIVNTLLLVLCEKIHCLPQFQFSVRKYIEQLRQCLTTISIHLKVLQKYTTAHHIFKSLLSVWKYGQTRSLVAVGFGDDYCQLIWKYGLSPCYSSFIELYHLFCVFIQLYGDFADEFGLAECKLAIVHCAGHYDPILIETLWKDIIEAGMHSLLCCGITLRQGSRDGAAVQSAHLPPMWPVFDSSPV